MGALKKFTQGKKHKASYLTAALKNFRQAYRCSGVYECMRACVFVQRLQRERSKTLHATGFSQ
ncbi:MAG: hypothetical protein LASZOEIN_000865 [Candidatus Fervidibacter sp.]|jgi:hypothetical protein